MKNALRTMFSVPKEAYLREEARLKRTRDGERARNLAPRLAAQSETLHVMRCGATMLMSSRDVITFVFFQNFGKCRWFAVTT